MGHMPVNHCSSPSTGPSHQQAETKLQNKRWQYHIAGAKVAPQGGNYLQESK